MDEALDATPGNALERMESSYVPLTLEITSSFVNRQLSWRVQDPERAEHNPENSTSMACFGTVRNSANVGFSECIGVIPLHFAPGATNTAPVATDAASAEDGSTIKDEESPEGPLLKAVMNTGSSRHWLAFLNRSTGLTVKLPAHDKAKKAPMSAGQALATARTTCWMTSSWRSPAGFTIDLLETCKAGGVQAGGRGSGT